MVARVSVPFTGGHYYGREEWPNTELADNSLSACRKIHGNINSIIRKVYDGILYNNLFLKTMIKG